MREHPQLPSEPRVAGWLADHGFASSRWEPLPGDVSPRRYFRLHTRGDCTAVLALYPRSLRSDCHRFLRSTRLLAGAGVPVPRVVAASCSAGLMLVEDVGPHTLYDLRRGGRRRLPAYFQRAAELADRIAALDPGSVAGLNPPLDTRLLRRELRQTRQVFLEPHGLGGDRAVAATLWPALDALCERLGESPPLPCHRDFMVRNLVPVGEPPDLCVLDHQGLRLGPPLYDLASLFNDSLFLRPEREQRLLAERLASDTERLAYHRAAAQRTLKAVGTYAAFARRGFPRHLALIPATLRRAWQHLASCPETRATAARIEPIWSPIWAADRPPAAPRC